MLYIPLNCGSACGQTFALGIFNTEEAARDCFLMFLMKHPNFSQWFSNMQKLYNERIKEIKAGTDFSYEPEDNWMYDELVLDNFKKALFESEFEWIDLDFTITTCEEDTLFPFYQWCDWVMTEPECPPEYNNLYKLINGCLNEHDVFGYYLDFKMEMYIEHFPII